MPGSDLCVLCERWRVTKAFVRLYQSGEPELIHTPRLDGYESSELAFPPRERWAGLVCPFVPLDPRTLFFDPRSNQGQGAFEWNGVHTFLRLFLLSPEGSRDWICKLMSVAFGQGGTKVEQVRRVTKACLWSLFPVAPRDAWEPHMIIPAALPLVTQLFPQGSNAPTTVSFIEALKAFATHSDPSLDFIVPSQSPSSTPSIPPPIDLPTPIRRIHRRLSPKEVVHVHLCPRHPEEAQKARIRLWDSKLFCACGLESTTVDLRGRIQWVEGFGWTMCSVCGKALSTLQAKSSPEEGAMGWRCLGC